MKVVRKIVISYLIYDCKETSKLGLVPGHRLKLFYKVIATLGRQKCQLVDIGSIAFLSEFERVLLQIKRS